MVYHTLDTTTVLNNNVVVFLLLIILILLILSHLLAKWEERCARRRRRALMDDAGVSYDRALEETTWQTYKETCNGFDYELSLLVDSHLYLIAHPSDEGVAAGCKPLAFHSTTSKRVDINDADADVAVDATHEKQILQIDARENDGEDEENGVYAIVEAFAKDNGISLGKHSFVDIAQAYDKAEANAPGMKTHDIVKNNCGDFVKSFGSELGVKATPELTVSIAQLLLEHGDEEFLDELRSSKYFALLLPVLKKSSGGMRGTKGSDKASEDDWNSEAVVTRLVEMRTEDMYGGGM